LDLSEYDLVISSSGAEAKGVKTGPNTKHITYCHAPTHYYWSRYDEYIEHPGFGIFNPLARLGLRLLVRPMRKWDYRAAQKPDYFIANSTHIKEQIKKYYGRDSEVIHPPVDIERFAPKAKVVKNGFLIAGRQTSYKRFDLAVAACRELGVALTVVGNGPEHNRLVDMAGPRTTFLTKVSDKDIPYYFQRAEGFIFPGIDDFGIVAVEALAASTPVIAYKAGGALDYVKPDKTGVLFEDQTIDSLMGALEEFAYKQFKTSTIIGKARSFSSDKFREKINQYLHKHKTE
jgi:glycosyltransferase involved in cell wall biosynthesis